jgi:hypothetical protein
MAERLGNTGFENYHLGWTHKETNMRRQTFLNTVKDRIICYREQNTISSNNKNNNSKIKQ